MQNFFSSLLTKLAFFPENFLDLFLDMSFYLLLGMAFAGLFHLILSPAFVAKHLGRRGFFTVVKAALLGVPLPLCSCGVIPTAVGFAKSGASKAAVTSFLISTPQTGIDNIIATGGMLGWFVGIFRPIAAFVSGIVGGLFVELFEKFFPEKKSQNVAAASSESENANEKSHCCCEGENSHLQNEQNHSCCEKESIKRDQNDCCCSQKKESPSACSCCPMFNQADKSHSHSEESCSCCAGTEGRQSDGCHNTAGKKSKREKFFYNIKEFFSFGFLKFTEELAVPLLLGILVAALLKTFIDTNQIQSLGITKGPLAILIMLLIGLPMYICSNTAIPLALSFLTLGFSPASVFVFLLAGPVTSATSIATLIKPLGKRTVLIYLVTVAIMAILFGLLFEFLLGEFNINLNSAIIDACCEKTPLYKYAAAWIFIVLLVRAFVVKFKPKQKKAGGCSCCH